YGAFIGCSNYPDCRFTRQLGDDPQAAPAAEDAPLGVDPETGLEVFLKTGRFGPYVQLGEEDKPKRASLPKGWEPASLTLEKALRLLSLPRDVGPHPEDGEMIQAGIGRYGPFVLHNKTYANLDSVEEVFEVGLNRAVSVLAEKRANGGRRGRQGAQPPLKELGPHPESGEPVVVMNGRYGPYVKHQKTNATLKKGLEPETVTLDQAVALLAEKEAKGGKTAKKGKSAKSGGAKSTKSAKSKSGKPKAAAAD
ncbi:MAG: topoisomerase DNA-binding C4 zinc finger domain-containing protein, partial [Caulobacterales bacterium]|nr:topoisomerase DNA-binding C4 zinc finger domain-containing protein [Caulobacterales bacterium]